MNNEMFQRWRRLQNAGVSVETFQECAGIRCTELTRLCSTDLVTDESGYLCIRARIADDGVCYLQRILPGKEDVARAAFARAVPGQLLMYPKLKKDSRRMLGEIRGRVIRQAYRHYEQELAADPSVRDRYVEEIRARCRATGRTCSPEFLDPRPYCLRGYMMEKAKAAGRPVQFDRLALTMTSIFHTGHYRTAAAICYLIS